MGKAVLFYASLGIAATAIIHGYASLLPGFATAPLYTPACFSAPGFRHISASQWLDQFNCILTRTFQAAQAYAPARAVADILGVYLIPCVVVMLYESSRPVHAMTSTGLLARSASFFLVLAQGIAGGLGIPLYFAAASASTSSGGAVAHSEALRAPKPAVALVAAALPPPRKAWACLAVAGYILPSIPLYLGLFSGWSFDALTRWQIFPLYVAALAFVLPRLAAAAPWTATEGSRAYAVIALSVLGFLPSLGAHWRLLTQPAQLADVFLLRPASPAVTGTLGHAMHIILLVDLVAIVLSSAAFVLTSDGGSGPDVRGRFLLFALLAALVGPGGALALMWGYRELCLTFAYERIAYGDEARLEQDEARIED